jgi:prepilin-type N-terminal cleavage/methylation domain-containing protein
MNRLRDESGFTLMELLVSSSLMLVVMGAVLTMLTGFQGTTRANGLRNDAQQQARTSMDALARDLRNGAAASADSPTGVESVASYDLVFQTVADSKPGGSTNSANLRRDRYCLDASNPANAKLVVQSQTWTSISAPAVPATSQCPSSAWGGSRVVAQNVVNRRGGADRPVFLPDVPAPSQVGRLVVQLYIDASRDSGGGGAHEAPLRSAVALRNANQPPTAVFTASLRANGDVVLNASGSSDPEGEQLSYAWFDGSTQLPSTALTYQYNAPSGPRHLKLAVYDPPGLRGVSEVKTVNVP